MEKPLALFDIDKTIYDGISYFSLVDKQAQEGLLSPVVADEAADAMGRYRAGSIEYEDFVADLLDIYATGCRGLPVDELQESTDDFFLRSDRFFEYAAPTVEALSETHDLVIVTGNTQFTAKAVAKVLDIPSSISSQLLVVNGIVTGTVGSYLATRYQKREAIEHLIDKHPHEGSFAFGDSEGDIEMLLAVENPVCIQPTAGLAKIAVGNNWHIVESAEVLHNAEPLAVVTSNPVRNQHVL